MIPMDPIIEGFCVRLDGAANVEEQYSQIERWAVDGETERLLQLAAALEEWEGMPALVRDIRKMSARQHPLAWLPLALTDIETELPIPFYSMRGSSVPLPFGPAPDPANSALSQRRPGSLAVPETTTTVERD